jgi:hypothetical protein
MRSTKLICGLSSLAGFACFVYVLAFDVRVITLHFCCTWILADKGLQEFEENMAQIDARMAVNMAQFKEARRLTGIDARMAKEARRLRVSGVQGEQ